MKVSAQVELTIDFEFHPDLNSEHSVKDQASFYISEYINRGHIGGLNVISVEPSEK